MSRLDDQLDEQQKGRNCHTHKSIQTGAWIQQLHDSPQIARGVFPLTTPICDYSSSWMSPPMSIMRSAPFG